MAAPGELSLVPYTVDVLDQSWTWLRDPEIRALTLTPEFTREQQLAFFASLPDRPDYAIWGIALRGVGVIGAAGLKNPRRPVIEYWGYLGERAYWGLGLGSGLVALLEEQARQRGYTGLDLKVAADNARAIALYRKAGFVADPAASTASVMHMAKSAI